MMLRFSPLRTCAAEMACIHLGGPRRPPVLLIHFVLYGWSLSDAPLIFCKGVSTRAAPRVPLSRRDLGYKDFRSEEFPSTPMRNRFLATEPHSNKPGHQRQNTAPEIARLFFLLGNFDFHQTSQRPPTLDRQESVQTLYFLFETPNLGTSNLTRFPNATFPTAFV
jgi:hypothetical protein